MSRKQTGVGFRRRWARLVPIAWLRPIAAAFVAAAALGLPGPAQARTPTLHLPGPARARPPLVQCPDPTILIGHAQVTLMCTGHGLPTRSATSLRGLSDARPHPAFAADGWPQWGTDGYWAPDLQYIGGRYLLYYSARRKQDRRRCIGVAVSTRPDGGFRDIGRPLIDDDPDGAIDPDVVIAGARVLLIYKRDGNAVRRPSVIYGRQLSADGLSVTGPKVELLRSRSRGWEQGVVEGPSAVQLGHTTYLIYSGGYFTAPGYAEGEAVRRGDPLGRYRRVSPLPILRGNGGWVGTGGGSIVVDGGRLLLAYNAFPARAPTARRALFIRRLVLEKGILRPANRATRIPLRRYLS